MTSEYIDIVQTAGILVTSIALVYGLWRLERAFQLAAKRLGKVITHQTEIQEGIERAWKRIDEVEARQGLRGNLDDRLQQLSSQLDEFSKRLEPLERNLARRQKPRPPPPAATRLLNRKSKP